jgi:AN1-type zinc finger and ubiquitin domain-containing protein 1
MRAFPASPILSSMSVSTSNIPPAFLLTTPIEADAEQKAAKEQKRCVAADCKKKLAFSDFPCRCGPRFCVAHRAAEDHKCTYDWKNEGKKVLTTTLAGCVNGKVERI